MKCPICHRAKCVWIELKPDPEKVHTDKILEVVHHNMSYIEMIFNGHQGSAFAEERLYNKLAPYTDELQRRGVR